VCYDVATAWLINVCSVHEQLAAMLDGINSIMFYAPQASAAADP
jgi:hypothetical protein